MSPTARPRPARRRGSRRPGGARSRAARRPGASRARVVSSSRPGPATLRPASLLKSQRSRATRVPPADMTGAFPPASVTVQSSRLTPGSARSTVMSAATTASPAERRRIGDRGMVGDGRAEVGRGLGRLDDVDLEVIDVDAIAAEPPIHEGHLGVDRIAGPGLEAAGGHADRVPTAGLGQIILHEVAVEVIRFLCIEMKVDAARGVIGPDAGLDAELEAGPFEAGQVERAGHAADDEGPPNIPPVPGRVDRDRGEASTREEVHDGAALARPEAPAGGARRVLDEGGSVEVVAELARERSAEEDRRGQDEPRSGQEPECLHAPPFRACSRSCAGSPCATRCRRALRRLSSGRRR